jgi:hypothetical protein
MYDVIYGVNIIKLNYGWLYVYFEHKYFFYKKTMHVMNLLALNKLFYRK